MTQKSGISKVTKYGIAVLSAFTCVCCVIFWVLSQDNSASPILTQPANIENPTALPTLTQQPIATEAIDIQANSEARAYADAALPHLTNYGDALTILTSLMQSAGNDPTLVTSDTWKAQMRTEMDKLEEGARGFQALPTPPAELVETDRWLQRTASETFIMTANMQKGIDTYEVSYIEEAGVNMRNITEYMANALVEIKEAFPE